MFKKTLAILLTIILTLMPLTGMTANNVKCTHTHNTACGYIEDTADCAYVCNEAAALPAVQEDEETEPEQADGGVQLSGASTGKTAVIIASFADLPEHIRWQEYAQGTINGINGLTLPKTLNATDTNGSDVTINGVTWKTMFYILRYPMPTLPEHFNF